MFKHKLKIGDKFKENKNLIGEVNEIKNDKHGKLIVYKMVDEYSLSYFGTHLKNEFCFYVGSQHYDNALANIL